MLITTGIIALSRKVADERAKKKEARQGHLTIGDSDVAKKAFQSQTSRMIEAGPANTGPKRAETDIKFQDPGDVSASSPNAYSPNIYSPRPEVHDARQSSQLDVTSPVKSEKGFLAPGSPYPETPTSPAAGNEQSPRNSSFQQLPPYTPQAESSKSALSPSVSSRAPIDSVMSRSDTKSNSDSKSKSSDSKSMGSHSVDSQGTHSVRVKTKGSDLKSGFAYHPALYDLNVHPTSWDSFTYQIIETTKFGTGDYAKMWGAATATAMTGAIGTSIFVGRSMNRSLQEKKVKAGLTDMSDGGLGELLGRWNEEYFSKRGLFVHLGLSDAAAKKPDTTFRKPSAFYSKKEDRERKREERKFMIVVTKLDEDGQPTEAMKSLADTEDGPVEIGSSSVEPMSNIAELPAEESIMAVEMPADTAQTAEKNSDPPGGYIEMDSDNTHLLEKLHFDDEQHSEQTAPQHYSTSQPLAWGSDPYGLNRGTG